MQRTLALWLSLGIAAACAQAPKSSADPGESTLGPPVIFPVRYQSEATVRQGKDSYEVFTAADGVKRRTEVRRGGKLMAVTIDRPDQQMRYQVNVVARTVARMPLTSAEPPLNPGSDPNAVWFALGADKIDGKAVAKYGMSAPVRQPNGSLHAEESLYWVDPATRLPVKIQQGTGSNATVTEFRNTRLGAPDKELFDVPAGLAPVQ